MGVKFVEGEIPGTFTIFPVTHRDNRGEFTEVFNSEVAHLFPNGIKQISQSFSRMGVARGLHFQFDPLMGKMMRVLSGTALIINVDLRVDEPSFLRHEFVLLSADHCKMSYAPGWCARGFLAVEDVVIEYWQDSVHCPSTAMTLDMFDSRIGVNFDKVSDLTEAFPTPWIMSEKDRNGMPLYEWLMYPECRELK